MSDADTVRVRAEVTGRVQGVGFRWATRAEAARLGLSGFARNSPDGSVRVEAEGAPLAVNALLEWLAHGPPGARVDDVVSEPLPTAGSSRFEIG